VRPLTVQLVAVLVVDEGHTSVVARGAVVSSALTVYPTIVVPPALVGAVQLTVADVVPPTAVTDVGGPGTVLLGVTDAEALEGDPVPTALMAATVNV
jgi:hypothetical protein